MESPEELFEDVVCFHHHSYISPEEYPIKPPLDFMVDDLFNFSNNDALSDVGVIDLAGGSSSVSPPPALVSSSSSGIISCHGNEAVRRTFPDNPIPGPDLHVPSEEVAELEWLSNFVEESFSSNDLQKLEEMSKEAAWPGSEKNVEKVVKGKARSKRARAGGCNWTAQGLVSPATSSEEGTSSGGESVWEKQVVGEKRERGEEEGGGKSCGRRCVHCDTDKTPQWRTGPMGPKTLCNACGVRYKSGRLVPEYRPASSPTFVLTKHSNSHRKVMELRRQKETHLHRQQRLQLQQLEESMIMDGVYEDDEDHQYLITDNWVNEGSYLL